MFGRCLSAQHKIYCEVVGTANRFIQKGLCNLLLLIIGCAY
jgi:hypothetical protein